ncbi:PPPDE putative peptidase domain-containing protein [Mucor mucedo]|uniref:PPPDE putative peptidase domain-containing protein n=1 Tax=Mucor mucedo TaxID=29922 RepID=UPI00221F1A9A|nr:PPPDE putative peptidase domain-containing protein [Mucor mucedo]KAI7885434.1 PPPDE putative peptidase domain-containing protein [Mucor mucedo]
MSEPVKLYVYDLSQGMARSMSRSLTGKQIDGIWHTSVVVFGQEFYFGQGIMASAPGTTQHGRPLEVIDMGETYLPLEVVVEYIDSLRSVYTAEKYHLLDFNCNTFSNDLCQFLCGKTIPGHITDLPAEFLNTPFGQSILPMIEGMFGQSKLSNGSSSIAPPPSAQAASMLQGVSSAAMSAAPTTVQPVQFVSDSNVMEKYLTQYKAVAVMFTSATCPPCKVIKPEFIKMVEEKHQGHGEIKLLGVVMDTGSPAFQSHKYNIRGVPTFQFFLNGKKTAEFSGANYAELKSQVDMLLFDAFPPHPHRKVLLRSIVDQPNVPITYAVPGKLDMIYGKLNTFLQEANIELDLNQKKVLDGSKAYLENPKSNSIDLNGWKLLLDQLLNKLKTDQLFPLLDIFKSLIIHKQVSDFYVTDPTQISKIMEIGYTQDPAPLRATWLMILRISCNIFANTSLSTTHFTSNLAASHRSELTQLLITSLLAEDAQIRQAAASLAYNCSTSIAIERLKKEEGTFKGMAEQEDDDWLVELSSAVLDALTKETDQEINIDGILNAKKNENIIESSKVLALARDISELVKLSSQE